jgi:hypothetical protein
VVTAPDISGHRVGGILGAGGFATVYRCWQLAVGREVAVKVDNGCSSPSVTGAGFSAR